MGPFSEKRKAIERALGEVFAGLPDVLGPERRSPEAQQKFDLYWLLIQFRNRCAEEDR